MLAIDIDTSIIIASGGVRLRGNLRIPKGAEGIVLFVHGSGSSRNSPRNRQVADSLVERGIATLLFDLLSDEEEAIDRRTAQFRFDTDLLAWRTLDAVKIVATDPRTSHLKRALFGASTGAAAALMVAAARPELVSAVVSRGGRPDLAGSALPRVFAPVLLIVGGEDLAVLEMNRGAQEELENARTTLEIVPGATHLFEEAGALEQVCQISGDWLVRQFALAQAVGEVGPELRT